MNERPDCRGGLTWAETLVILLILVLLTGLTLVGVMKVRARACHDECVQNLKFVGLEIQNYHDVLDGFCQETAGGERSFYVELYLAHSNVDVRTGMLRKWNPQMSVKRWICPGRRSAEETGARADYCSTVWSGENQTIISGNNSRQDRVTIKQICAADGSAQTIMLAHKGMPPRDYAATADPFFYDPPFNGLAGDRFRSSTAAFVRDSAATTTSDCASPHWAGMPCLFADGTVRTISYSAPASVVSALWYWNAGQPIPKEWRGD